MSEEEADHCIVESTCQAQDNDNSLLEGPYEQLQHRNDAAFLQLAPVDT